MDGFTTRSPPPQPIHHVTACTAPVEPSPSRSPPPQLIHHVTAHTAPIITQTPNSNHLSAPTVIFPAVPPAMDGFTTGNPPPQPVHHVTTARTAPVIMQSPSPNPHHLSAPTVKFPAVYQAPALNGAISSFGAASIPKGGSSEGFGGLENFLRRVHNNSLSRCGLSDGLQPQPLFCPTNMQSCIPYEPSKGSVHVETGTTHNISGASAHVGYCATPCYSIKATGHMKNGTTPNNISELPCHVENGTLPNKISETSTRVSSSSLTPEHSSRQSDTVLGNNSGLKPYSTFPIEIRRVECVQLGQTPARRRARRVRSYPLKEIPSDVHKEGKSKVNNDRKRAAEATDNHRAQLEQAESAKQLMATDGNAVQHSSSCRPHANCGGIPGEASGSSAFMAKDAPLCVILDSLRYLSDALLSSRFDACELKDHDLEFLQSVTDKLGAFLIKNKKVDTISSEWEHVAEPEIKTSMRGGDEVIGPDLNVSAVLTDGELDSCTTKTASGGDGISSEWEHVDEAMLY